MKKTETIASRVRWLLDSRGLSVNAAAGLRASGVPQRTLARIVANDSKQPRVDAVQKLAAYFKVTERWLLTGEGEMSAGMQAWKEDKQQWREQARRNWYELVRALDLPASTEQAVYRVPEASAAAMNLFGQEIGFTDEQRAFLGENCYLEELPAWTLWLATMLQRVGRDAVRTLLVKRETDVRARFAGFPPAMMLPPRLPSETPKDANRVVSPPELPIPTEARQPLKQPPLAHR